MSTQEIKTKIAEYNRSSQSPQRGGSFEDIFV